MEDWKEFTVVMWRRSLSIAKMSDWGSPVAFAKAYLRRWSPKPSTAFQKRNDVRFIVVC